MALSVEVETFENKVVDVGVELPVPERLFMDNQIRQWLVFG